MLTAAMLVGGSSLFSAGIGASSSSKAASAQEEAMAQERAAREKDLAFRQQMYNEEKAFYDPMRNQLRTMAMGNQSIGYTQNAAEIKKQYADALRGITGQGGVTNGLAGGAGRQAMFGQAQDLTKAYDAGQLAKLNLQQSFLGMDQSTPLALNVGGAYTNQGNMYGENAKTFGNIAGLASAAAANALTSGANSIGKVYGMNV